MSISDKKTRIQVTIPKETKNKLENKAKSSNRSISNYVANLIDQDLKKEIFHKD